VRPSGSTPEYRLVPQYIAYGTPRTIPRPVRGRCGPVAYASAQYRAVASLVCSVARKSANSGSVSSVAAQIARFAEHSSATNCTPLTQCPLCPYSPSVIARTDGTSCFGVVRLQRRLVCPGPQRSRPPHADDATTSAPGLQAYSAPASIARTRPSTRSSGKAQTQAGDNTAHGRPVRNKQAAERTKQRTRGCGMHARTQLRRVCRPCALRPLRACTTRAHMRQSRTCKEQAGGRVG
jgi:hypothetical protein